jgi:hypothetical protein
MTTHRRLPFRITLLLGLVLIVTVLSTIRALTALAWHDALGHYTSGGLVTYDALSGLAWMLAGAFLFGCILRRGSHTRWMVLAVTGAYAAWAWIDRLLVQQGPRANWPFGAVVSIVLLAFVAGVVLDPHNLSYFEKREYERQPEDPTSA